MLDVLATIAAETKTERKTKSEPKRYVPYTLDEWRELVEKPLGRSMTAQEAKAFFAKLLAGIADGSLVLEKK